MNIELLLYWQSSGDQTGVVCCGGVLLFLVVIVIVGVKASNDQAKQMTAARDREAKQLKAARDAYFDNLQRLKANPANADLRQRTLQLGRTYSNLTRNQSGVTIFDEVALANDLNAACAGAARLVVNTSNQSQTIESRLQHLTELRNKDLIDPEEYATRRKQIIDEV